jgi:hypothetical protein
MNPILQTRFADGLRHLLTLAFAAFGTWAGVILSQRLNLTPAQVAQLGTAAQSLTGPITTLVLSLAAIGLQFAWTWLAKNDPELVSIINLGARFLGPSSPAPSPLGAKGPGGFTFPQCLGFIALVGLCFVGPVYFGGCTSAQENDFAAAMSNPQTISAISNTTAAALTIASIKDPSLAKYVPAIQKAVPGALVTAGSISGAVAQATAAANTSIGGNLTPSQQAVVSSIITGAVAGNLTVTPEGNVTTAPPAAVAVYIGNITGNSTTGP